MTALRQPLAAPIQIFTQGGDIGIVAHLHPQAAQQLGQLYPGIAVAPAAQVGADDGHNAGILHRAGHAQAHALDLVGAQAALCHFVLHGGGQVGQDAHTLVRSVGGHLPFFQQITGGGKQTDLGGGAAQVDAKCIFLHILLPLFCVSVGPYFVSPKYNISGEKKQMASAFL